MAAHSLRKYRVPSSYIYHVIVYVNLGSLSHIIAILMSQMSAHPLAAPIGPLLQDYGTVTVFQLTLCCQSVS